MTGTMTHEDITQWVQNATDKMLADDIIGCDNWLKTHDQTHSHYDERVWYRDLLISELNRRHSSSNKEVSE